MTDEEGNAEVTFSVNNLFYINQLKEMDKEVKYSIEVKNLKSKRSDEQNRYMWALLNEIDKKMNGNRSNDSFHIYCQCLEKSGAKHDIYKAPLQAEKDLKKAFRAVRLIRCFDNGYAEFDCYYGSSTFNTEEMSNLIDCVLDLAAEVGIETDYWSNALK